MPINITWGNQEKTLIIEKFIEPWTANELMYMIERGVNMVSSVQHKVDIVVDFQYASFHVPVQFLSAVKRIRQIGKMNRGKVIIVKAPSFIQSLIRFAQEFAPEAYSDFQFATTMAEAYQILGVAINK